MASKPRYETDSFLPELDTQIVGTGKEGERFYVLLEETIFYPEGGGQPADRGTIGGVALTDVQKGEDGVRHFLGQTLPAGPARAVLDWPRRRDHMQQHTGQHLLTSLAEDKFGWATTAFHLGEQVCDIELAVKSLSPEQLASLENALALVIAAARPIKSRYVTTEEFSRLPVRTRGLPEGFTGDIRLVEIEGTDCNTCGGTHLHHTGEVGALSLLGTESLRGGTRLFFVAGDRVRRRLREQELRFGRLRTLLGVPDEELPAAVEGRLAQLKAGARRERTLAGELATALAANLAKTPDRLIARHFSDKDAAFLSELGREFTSASPAKAALFTAGGETTGYFLIVVGAELNCDLAGLGKEIATILGGRGGGRGGVFQGKAESLNNRLDALAILAAGLGES